MGSALRGQVTPLPFLDNPYPDGARRALSVGYSVMVSHAFPECSGAGGAGRRGSGSRCQYSQYRAGSGPTHRLGSAAGLCLGVG